MEYKSCVHLGGENQVKPKLVPMKKIILIASLLLALSACVKTNHNQSSNPPTPSNDNVVYQDKKAPPSPNSSPSKKENLTIESDYEMEESVAEYIDVQHSSISSKSISRSGNTAEIKSYKPSPDSYYEQQPVQEFNTEGYAYTPENEYKKVSADPLSTFSIDVDAASYTNTRRFLNSGSLPPTDAVRIEEFINYFSYNYSTPNEADPFSINTEYAPCPWNKNHQLIHIGLQGKRYDFQRNESNELSFSCRCIWIYE